MLSLINANSFEEMRHIAAGNKEALSIVETLEKIMLDEKVSLAYNIEKENRKLELTGFEKGYDEGKAEGISLVTISKVTNLSIDEIENLN